MNEHFNWMSLTFVLCARVLAHVRWSTSPDGGAVCTHECVRVSAGQRRWAGSVSRAALSQWFTLHSLGQNPIRTAIWWPIRAPSCDVTATEHWVPWEPGEVNAMNHIGALCCQSWAVGPRSRLAGHSYVSISTLNDEVWGGKLCRWPGCWVTDTRLLWFVWAALCLFLSTSKLAPLACI